MRGGSSECTIIMTALFRLNSIILPKDRSANWEIQRLTDSGYSYRHERETGGEQFHLSSCL